MPFDPHAANLSVAVIGTGTMGRGIVQVSAQGGMAVIAYDEKPGAAAAAKAYIAKILGGLVEKGRVSAADRTATLDRITIATSLDDVAKANIVVEAIIERLDITQALFERLQPVRARRDPGVEHLVAAGHRDRRQVPASRAGGRHALLQPCTRDEAR